MDGHTNVLTMRFDGTVTDRRKFLMKIRLVVIGLTGGRHSLLDALINEIAKNIFDHARGLGSLAIETLDDSFEFEIRDDGRTSYDFDFCKRNSTLAGNGTNHGIGLGIIEDFKTCEEIDLQIDTSQGFRYLGTYTPKRKGSV